MKNVFTAAALSAASLSLSACASLPPLTGNPAGDAKAVAANIVTTTDPRQFLSELKAFNEAAGQVCGGWGNVDWNPPLPPTGSLHAQCAFGKQALQGPLAPGSQPPSALSAPPPQ